MLPSDKRLSNLEEWAQSYNVKCGCPRGNIASYFCNVEDCKDKAERFSCMQCVAEDRKHISHPVTQIKNELQKRIEEWQELVENFTQLKKLIDDSYPSIRPIINYLDNENLLKTNLNVKAPSNYVSQDVNEFNDEFIKVIKMME